MSNYCRVVKICPSNMWLLVVKICRNMDSNIVGGHLIGVVVVSQKLYVFSATTPAWSDKYRGFYPAWQSWSLDNVGFTWNWNVDRKKKHQKHHNWLVVWNINFIFPYIGNLIIPIDEVIFFRGVAQPPTRSSLVSCKGEYSEWAPRNSQLGSRFTNRRWGLWRWKRMLRSRGSEGCLDLAKNPRGPEVSENRPPQNRFLWSWFQMISPWRCHHLAWSIVVS